MKIFALTTDLYPVRETWEGRIISVFLSRDKKKHNFRCCECGKIIFQYTGEIGFIFDGAVIPEDKAVIDTMCHRCKIIYRTM